MKVLIVDDEVLARARLQKLLSEIDGIEVIGEAGNGTEAIKQVHALQPELVLLDLVPLCWQELQFILLDLIK